jgi:hypothetical protein
LRRKYPVAFLRHEKMTNRVNRSLSAAFTTLLASAAFAVTAAHAALILPAYPTVDPGPSTTAWFTDRYAPSSFSNVGALFGRNDVLAIVLSSADGAASRPPAYSAAFYNTQGRKIDVGLPLPASWIASVYLPASWATTNVGDSVLNRRTDLWATLKDGANAPTYYPIIGFTNADAATGFGGTPRFRVFDGTGNWNDLATPVAFGAWTDIGVTFTGTTIEYRINGALVFTDSHADIALGTQVGDVMLQAYNWGSDYTANWSQAAAGQATVAQLHALFAPAPTPSIPVPVGPLAPALSALAIALAALLRRRR